MTQDTPDTIESRLMRALSTGDFDGLAALLAPGFEYWINLTGRVQGADEFLGRLRVEATVMAESELTVRDRVGTEDGFVLHLVASGTTRGGVPFHVPACVIARVDGDQIVRIDEYTNIGDAKPIIREMVAAAAATT